MKLRDSWRFGGTSLGSVFTSGTMASAVSNQACSQNKTTSCFTLLHPSAQLPRTHFAQV